MKTTRPLPSFQGVAAGQTATLNAPIGLTYHGVLLSYSGVTLAQLTEFRIKGNGRQIFTQSLSDLDTCCQFDGLEPSAGGLIYIPFDREKLLTRAGQELTAIGTGMPVNNDPGTPQAPNALYNPTPLSTFQFEIDIDAAAAAPVLSAQAVQSAARPLGVMLKRRRFNYAITGAGDYEISDLPKGDLINKIWMKQANGVVTKVKLERDNFLAFERTASQNDYLQSNGVRVPQPDWYVIDPTEKGYGSESIVSAVNDFRLTITTSGAENIVLYVDYLGALSGN